MRVAIIHYHLRPGGVTRVIQNAVSALATSAIRSVVFAGEPPSPSMPVPNYAVIESLGYSNAAPAHSPVSIIHDLAAIAKRTLGEMPDVWHIHNHALGKNLIMSDVVYHLAQQGQRVLLQIHDFAEDGRPENYKFLRNNLCPETPKLLGARLYPQGTHIHYALINQRDLNFLKIAGTNLQQLHYLPNAVSMEEDSQKGVLPDQDDRVSSQCAQRLFFYPARAIRRKNLGEFLLWAAIAEEDDVFAIARAPKNPLARPIYEDWVNFAQSLQLPIKFEAGKQWQGNFPSLLKSAHALVTTSVAEGFGLAFLEPWLVMRPLVGRNLAEITDAIQSAGLDLTDLYHHLKIPLEWVGKQRFHQEVSQQLRNAYEAYGRIVHKDDIDCAVSAAVEDNYIDFGKLHEDLQKPVIERLVRSMSSRSEITPSALKPKEEQHERIHRNYTIVKEQFNLHQYSNRLLRLYQTVAASETGPIGQLNAEVLLDQFLAPERFCLLRT